MKPDYFNSDDADGDRVTCATFNICTIDLIDVETERAMTQTSSRTEISGTA